MRAHDLKGIIKTLNFEELVLQWYCNCKDKCKIPLTFFHHFYKNAMKCTNLHNFSAPQANFFKKGECWNSAKQKFPLLFEKKSNSPDYF